MSQTPTSTAALEAFAAAMPVPVCLVETDPADPRRSHLRFSNELARSRFGSNVGSGVAVDDVFPPDVVAGRVSEVCARAAERGDPEHLRLLRGDGTGAGVPGEVVLVRRLDPHIVALVCDSHSSDWQRAEFHAVVDSALEAILTKNLDGIILSWNAAATRLYGYTEEEAVGMPVTALLPVDRQNEVAEIIARLRAGERIDEFETTRVRKDGSTVEVSLTITPVRRTGGMIVGAATIARDVTERRLAESRRRLAAIVEATFYPVFSVDLDGRVLTWNAAAERLFGYGAAEMLGEPLSSLFGSAPLPPRMLSPAMLRGHDLAEPFEISTKTKAGADLVVEVSVSAILDDHDAVTAAAVVLRDVTEQRHLEQRLAQKQKLEAIGSLASGVAHDFNNVLSIIRSAAGLLAREQTDPGSRELIEEIDRAAVHAADLTAQLLAFGRKQLLHPEPTDLNAEITQTMGMIRSLVTARVEVRQDLADGLPLIQIDRNQLTQIVINLCANASEAMPDGGTLTLRTRLAPIAVSDGVSGSRASRRVGLKADVVLEVIDTGDGIDAETLSHVFDPFYTTKQTGTGLGLATVHGIVDQSGGHIEVDSEQDAGTTFSVYFPASSASRSDEHVEDARAPLKGHETVLVADDSPALRMVFERVLQSAGYDVLIAGDGIEALEIAEAAGRPIDLLLTDVVMPGMGGRELYERLRERWPDLRVVFSSGYASDEVLRHGISTGQFDYLPKPSTNEAILAQLRTTLDRAKPGVRGAGA